ncbi:hypothetical protein C0J52_28496 [Blattella germanica]|nr:hypothetical protein C0J52_28496 [Blattella germanica]
MLYTDVYYDNEKVAAAMEKHNFLRDLDFLRLSVAEGKLLNKKLHKFIQKLKEFYSFLGEKEICQPFKTEFVSDLINLDYWQEILSNKMYEVEDHEKYLYSESFRILMQNKIHPSIQGIIFLIGFIGNAILLTIFSKHKELRTASGMMILNLAFCDSFNLIINIPLFYIYMSYSELITGSSLCIIFRFVSQLGIAVSIYSVVMISIQRYLAFANVFKTHKCVGLFRKSNRLTSNVSILSVWLIGVSIAIPHSINAGMYKNNCYGVSQSDDGLSKFISPFNFVLFCVIPITFITGLSIATACIIRGSISDMPGEPIGMDKHIKSRIVSSRVLISLAVVSALSYIPYYAFVFLHSLVNFGLEKSKFIAVFLVLYTLTFVNCCFNPIALYIFSCNFRNYFNKYLLFCIFIKQKDNSRKHSNEKTSSSFVTRL